MTKEEELAFDLALEALEPFSTPNWAGTGVDKVNAAITAIRKVRSAPVQEPVVDEWTPCMKLPVVVHVRKQRPGESHVSTREGITPVKPDDLIMRGVSGEEYPIGRAIFEQTYTMDTTKPAAQRTWVGLTDEEYSDLYFSVGYAENVALWQAIEAKLMEKNNGGPQLRESP
jgi:hypothetical protein